MLSSKIEDASLKLRSFVKTSSPSADARQVHIGFNKYSTLHTPLKGGSLLKVKKCTVVSHMHRQHSGLAQG